MAELTLEQQKAVALATARLRLQGGESRLTAAQRTVDGVKNLFTGDNRREFDYPDLLSLLPTDAVGGLPNLQQLGSVFGLNEEPVLESPGRFPMTASQTDTFKNALTLAQDPQQIADVITKHLPGAEITTDSFGNPVITYEGQSAYFNRPGLSGQDLAAAAGFGATTAATLAPVAGPLARMALLPRMATVGAGTGAASAGQDVALNQMGAEKVVDPPRVALMTAMGAGFELLGPAAKWAYSQIVRRPQLYNTVTQQLTPLGVQRLKEAGLTPGQITDDFARKFAEEAGKAVTPDDAARLAGAQSLPVPVPLTKGQTTLMPADQMLEDQMLKGVYGQGASTRMSEVIGPEGTQQTALRQNLPAIQGQIGATAAPLAAGRGASTLQAEMLARRDALKGQVKTAYDAARDTSAAVDIGVVRQGVFDIERAVAGQFDASGIPRVSGLLDELKTLVPADVTDAAVLVRSLYDWRRKASTLKGLSGDPVEATAIGAAIKEFDRFTDDMIEKALISGDQSAITAWKEAIALRKELGTKFEGGDLIEDLTMRQYRGGGSVLKVAPEDAANFIFGSSSTGWIPKLNMTRDLARMKNMLGANSQAWNALREEAFMRFARAAEGQMQADIRMISGANFKKAWDDAWSNNSDVMRVLFTPDERKLITQFANTASLVTQPVRGGQNFSNTTAAAAQAAQKLLGMFGPKVGALLKGFLPLARPAANAVREVQAMNRGNFRPSLPAPLPGIGAAGAYGVENLP